ncbi:hypothetical protein BV25DRAFT_1915217 [Artomyces pyxidatus]|uniref:Uncharacterized protein n=1 Tax=Artomyces pyxidatus TaxID=48021 RepID=A0ACB8T373_9AGAM|nr:hypothetical protein BV25DRAFT_1915217 [Artomyces pyxidatus]
MNSDDDEAGIACDRSPRLPRLVFVYNSFRNPCVVRNLLCRATEPTLAPAIVCGMAAKLIVGASRRVLVYAGSGQRAAEGMVFAVTGWEELHVLGQYHGEDHKLVHCTIRLVRSGETARAATFMWDGPAEDLAEDEPKPPVFFHH